ncbi:MAG: thioredoxin family protein [Anaerolineae bacterium]
MLSIKVLGPGCSNCYVLEGLVIAAVQVLNDQKPHLFEDVEVTLDHLTEQSDFRKYRIMFTPGLVINEKLIAAGRLPSVLEIMAAIEKQLAANAQPAQAERQSA